MIQQGRFDHQQDCIFCKIIAGELPTTKIMETEGFLVIKDLHPKAPVHVLVIPKKHIETLDQVKVADGQLMGEMVQVVQQAAERSGVAGAYQVRINVGESAGQVIFHLHWHIFGGWQQPQTN